MGQELNCRVMVNSSLIDGTNTSVFKTLENSISEYLNTTRFTNRNFSPVEKIECSLFLNITGYSNNHFTAELQIQSIRPVYNSTYTTSLLNFRDPEVHFDYYEYEPLEFTILNNRSQLTALLNFYAYMILALDFDSFAPRGGQEYYERARSVVMEAQNTGDSGWQLYQDNRNRAALLSAFSESPTAGFRDILYEYHREGLDEMATSPEKARNTILETITVNLRKINSNYPFSVGLNVFHDTKFDELLNIFGPSTSKEKKEVKQLLEEVYPYESDRIRAL